MPGWSRMRSPLFSLFMCVVNRFKLSRLPVLIVYLLYNVDKCVLKVESGLERRERDGKGRGRKRFAKSRVDVRRDSRLFPSILGPYLVADGSTTSRGALCVFLSVKQHEKRCFVEKSRPCERGVEKIMKFVQLSYKRVQLPHKREQLSHKQVQLSSKTGTYLTHLYMYRKTGIFVRKLYEFCARVVPPRDLGCRRFLLFW